MAGFSQVTHSPTIMPQALTSPISFLSATPPPDSFSAAASLAEPEVLLRCLAPSVILMAELGFFFFFFKKLDVVSSSAPDADPCVCLASSPCVSLVVKKTTLTENVLHLSDEETWLLRCQQPATITAIRNQQQNLGYLKKKKIKLQK